MDYTKIKTERQFKAATGCSKNEFEELSILFVSSYVDEHEQTYEEYIRKNVTETPIFQTLDKWLFFVLFQLKNNLIYDSLGVVFGMGASTAHDNFTYFLKLLENTLKKKEVYPKRSYGNVEEFEEDLKNEGEIIFDGVEMERNRPKDAENQKDTYSGKKKRNTDAAMVMSNKNRWIFYVSELYCGSCHDFGIFKSEFEPGLGWFRNFKVILDLGFTGFAQLYKSKDLLIGFKRPRKSKNNPNPEDLTKEQKDWNRTVSKERIYVEHAIGGMKRYRILSNRNRLKCDDLKNRILGVCAGLWNFKLLLNH